MLFRSWVFEVTQRITEKPLKKCPTCKSKVERIISATSFVLKGTGWYATDYAKPGATKMDSQTDAKSDSKSESSSEPAKSGSSSTTDSAGNGAATSAKSTTQSAKPAADKTAGKSSD